MRANLNPQRIRRVKLIAYAGKNLVANIPNEDSARDPENFSGFTAFGKIVDETGTLVLDLVPTVDSARALYEIDVLVPGGTTAGFYRWRGGLIDSAGDEDVRYEGPVHIRTF